MAVTIERFDGKFPPRLALDPVRVPPISECRFDHAGEATDELVEEGFRVEVETRDWTIGRTVAEGHEDRVLSMLIVGDDAVEAGTVSVRDWKEREEGGVERDSFLAHFLGNARRRA